MTINHHPTDETLLAFAAGQLDAGRAIVVAAHMERCERCSQLQLRFCGVGGAMLADCVPQPMAGDALARALSRIEAADDIARGAADAAVSSEPATLPTDLDEVEALLPATVRGLKLSGWQWIGPGIRRCVVEAPESDGARVFLLKAAPGTRMPEHTHTGSELTLVLRGAFRHGGGRYGPGDFDEADDTVEHQPLVEAGEPCICLVAMDGSLKLTGGFGRLLQPFVRV